MPWDGTELWMAELSPEGGSWATPRLVAGGAEESIFQPEWSPDGVLHFVSDRTGWWNLYRARRRPATSRSRRWRPSSARRSGCSACSTYAFLADGRIACMYFTRRRCSGSALLSTGRGRVERRSEASHVPFGLPALRSHGSAARVRRRVPDRGRRRSCRSTSRPGALEVLARSIGGGDRPRLRLGPARDRVPDRGRADGARAVLSAAPTATSRPRRTSARR